MHLRPRKQSARAAERRRKFVLHASQSSAQGDRAQRFSEATDCHAEAKNSFHCCDYSDNVRNRKAFPITDTELNVIAAAAIIGLSKMPKTGYSTPAAIGTPRAL
jgi:hypothetical protein